MKKFKDKEYSIGKYTLKYNQFKKIMEQFPYVKDISNAGVIKGPFDGKINSMYLFRGVSEKDVLFRCRVSQAFRYEDIAKEKILYRYLDGTFSKFTENLAKKIEEITKKQEGNYIFSEERPPIVPVQNLLYFYEPEEEYKKNHNRSGSYDPSDILPPNKFPYIVTIKDYIPGRSFYEVLQNCPGEQKHSPAIRKLFERSGEILGELHNHIQFDSFYDKITEIGSDKKHTWIELFKKQWKRNVEDAGQYKAMKPLLQDLKEYYEENIHLVKDEDEAVFFHNDYQAQNIITQDDPSLGYDDPDKFKIIGLIDFDNWRIGPRAQDFVKMEYWTIQGDKKWLESFYTGYSTKYSIGTDMKKKIEVYKLLWFILVYAFEMDKVSKNELNSAVDQRFPSAEKYITEITKILRDE